MCKMSFLLKVNMKKIELYNRHEQKSPFNGLIEEEILGSGIEGVVRRVKLVHLDRDRIIDGFVQKEFHLDEGYEKEIEDRFLISIENWKRIKDLVYLRRQEGKTFFRIPGTVRPYISDDGKFGFIMTDLSIGGEKQVLPLSELYNKYLQDPNYLTLEQWSDILRQAERDLSIAKEERIKLKSGLLGLDAWMIVTDEGGLSQLVLTDIGSFTHFDISISNAERYYISQKNSLNTLDKLIRKTIAPKEFWIERNKLS